MSFTERDCGITAPHRHTGIFEEGYVINYFCELDQGGCNSLGKAWVENSLCIATGEPHARCRTEHNITEEIELISEEFRVEPENDSYFVSWIKNELAQSLKEKFAELPWWCGICGVGGNYDGVRPDEYWWPPLDHECDLSNTTEKLGIGKAKGLRPVVSVYDEIHLDDDHRFAPAVSWDPENGMSVVKSQHLTAREIKEDVLNPMYKPDRFDVV